MTNRAIVHGTGLIGASVGLALRAAGWEVSGWDPDPERLSEAVRRGAIVEALPAMTSNLDDVTLLVLAGPPSEVEKSLPELEAHTLVTDVAGVKAPIVAAASGLERFVGGHPMAGGTSTGPSLASSTLFHGATWVLTSDRARPADLDQMRATVRSMGANPVVMTAEEHDRSVAVVSHLPHVVAGLLLRLAEDEDEDEALQLAGGGFRDLTRVAGSAGSWWAELLLANRREVTVAIQNLEAGLATWRQALDAGDRESLQGALEMARRTRGRLGDTQVQVGVILQDEPGEIARIGRALEQSKVDVRDFQLRHGEHGGGGVLTITVTPEGEHGLRTAVEAQGFQVQP